MHVFLVKAEVGPLHANVHCRACYKESYVSALLRSLWVSSCPFFRIFFWDLSKILHKEALISEMKRALTVGQIGDG